MVGASTLPATGPISFSEIRKMYAGGSNNNLGYYYKGVKSQTFGTASYPVVPDAPSSSGVPSSGAISFSHFRGTAKEYNVDAINANTNKYNLKTNFDSKFATTATTNKVTIHGYNDYGYYTRLTINSNKTVYSDSTATPALTVGSFPSSSTVIIDNNGSIYGMGGSGGSGGGGGAGGSGGLGGNGGTSSGNWGYAGDNGNNGNNGSAGSSGGAGGTALNARDSSGRVEVNNSGYIKGGGGGGGGGGGAGGGGGGTGGGGGGKGAAGREERNYNGNRWSIQERDVFNTCWYCSDNDGYWTAYAYWDNVNVRTISDIGGYRNCCFFEGNTDIVRALVNTSLPYFIDERSVRQAVYSEYNICRYWQSSGGNGATGGTGQAGGGGGAGGTGGRGSYFNGSSTVNAAAGSSGANGGSASGNTSPGSAGSGVYYFDASSGSGGGGGYGGGGGGGGLGGSGASGGGLGEAGTTVTATAYAGNSGGIGTDGGYGNVNSRGEGYYRGGGGSRGLTVGTGGSGASGGSGGAAGNSIIFSSSVNSYTVTGSTNTTYIKPAYVAT